MKMDMMNINHTQIKMQNNSTRKNPSSIIMSDLIMSELRAYQNLLTSSKIAPLCLRQVLVVRKSKIQI